MDIPDLTEVIKTTFQSIVDKNVEIQKYIEELNNKKNKLNSLYKQLLDENNNIVNTLDIFNFQIRLLTNDIVYLQQKYNNINNRIYCQYFKIYLQVQEYIVESITDIHIPKTSFPSYDDTNLNKVYDFNTICDIHTYICNLISAIIEYIKLRNNEYRKYKTINNVGVHINVFVDTFKYNIKSKIEQMILFTSMVRFYNTTGLNYYNKIFNSIEFIHNNISIDVSFDTLEHISLNPDYIDNTPLQPLESEEYPTPSPSPKLEFQTTDNNVDTNAHTSKIVREIPITFQTSKVYEPVAVPTVKPAVTQNIKVSTQQTAPTSQLAIKPSGPPGPIMQTARPAIVSNVPVQVTVKGT